jgi:hypothetical protein
MVFEWKGDAPAASALKEPPADLTLLAKNNQRKYPVVTYVLQSGVGAPAHGSKDMPIWASVRCAS